jgi:cytochrome P450
MAAESKSGARARNDELARLEESMRDPYPEWRARRARCPVELRETSGFRMVEVLRRDDVEASLRNEATFSSRILQDSMGPYMGAVLLGKDGREHTVFRNLVSHAFRRSALERWETELIHPTIHELLDRIASLGRADLVRDVTRQYPVKVITGLIGVPVADIGQFQEWAEDISSGPLRHERSLASSHAMREYLTPIVEDRKIHPRDDLISDIVHAEIDGARLDDEHIYGFLRLLMPAGAETTYRVMGNTLTALLSHPNVLERVRQDRSLVPRAIEETLRWETSVTFVSRVAKHDTAIGGCPVPAGTLVSLVLGSANHDEAHWDDPESWSIDRPAEPSHIAFGWGRHLCIGMHLARMELRVGINAVLDRLPNLRLDPGEPPPEIRGNAFRGPTTLPVLFDA